MLKTYQEFETFEYVSAYLKQYPRFSRLIVFDVPVKTKIPGFETAEKHHKTKSKTANPLAFFESVRRAKTKITDITLCNEFDLFCTFTFKNDRQNILKLKKQMSQWLKNEKQKHGAFSYVIVPEFHKDGKSIHFHALFKNYCGKLIDSGKLINSRKAWNLNSYRLGFSTAVKIDNIEKVSSYVKKYITKEMPKFPGKKRYWCSTKLQRPKVIRNPQIDPYTMQDFEERWRVKSLTILETKYKVSEVPINAKGIDEPINRQHSSGHRGQNVNEQRWEALLTAYRPYRGRLHDGILPVQ